MVHKIRVNAKAPLPARKLDPGFKTTAILSSVLLVVLVAFCYYPSSVALFAVVEVLVGPDARSQSHQCSSMVDGYNHRIVHRT